jgi:hypothetical protein
MEEQNKQRWMMATPQNRTKKKAGLLFTSVAAFTFHLVVSLKIHRTICTKNSSQKNVENSKLRIGLCISGNASFSV